jgi:hypothetical protein
MEEDDDFGDLYTDITIPSSAPAETLRRQLPNPNPTPAAAAAVVDDDDDWLLGGNDPIPGVDPTGDWADEDADGAAPAPTAPGKRVTAAVPSNPALAADDLDPLMGGGVGDSGPAIPGLSSSAATGAAGSDEWDSDSEDDIQIVLNETDGRRRLGEDEGDDLVIVADDPHIPGMEEQDWGEDPTATGAEGERKDGGEPGKAAAVPGGRIGYSGGGQGFHPQHHSMFKVSYLGHEAVRCARATPAEGDSVNPVSTHYALCCTVLPRVNFFSSLVSFNEILRSCLSFNSVTVNAFLTYNGRKKESNDHAFSIRSLHKAFQTFSPSPMYGPSPWLLSILPLGGSCSVPVGYSVANTTTTKPFSPKKTNKSSITNQQSNFSLQMRM